MKGIFSSGYFPRCTFTAVPVSHKHCLACNPLMAKHQTGAQPCCCSLLLIFLFLCLFHLKSVYSSAHFCSCWSFCSINCMPPWLKSQQLLHFHFLLWGWIIAKQGLQEQKQKEREIRLWISFSRQCEFLRVPFTNAAHELNLKYFPSQWLK